MKPGPAQLSGGASTVMMLALCILTFAGWIYPARYWMYLATGGLTLFLLAAGVFGLRCPAGLGR